MLDSASDSHHRARLLAVAAPHAGDWLHALTISSCRLRQHDEAIRVSVRTPPESECLLTPSLPLWNTSRCPRHAWFFVQITSSRMAGHHHFIDMIWRALSRAGILSRKEPSGLLRADVKRPDGMTLIPWKAGRNVLLDVMPNTMSLPRLIPSSQSLARTYQHQSSLLSC